MDVDDDLGAEIAAAYKEVSEGAPAPVAAAPAAVAAEPVVAAAPAEGATPRDATGRFAPKAGEAAPAAAAQPNPADLPAGAAPEAQGEPIRPPASWSAQAKSDFAALPPHIQQEVLKREREMDKGLQERSSQLKRYEPLEQVIAPHRDRIHLQGVDEATYVRSLITADEMLRGPNRLQALGQIAQTYGIDLRQLGQPGPQQQQAQLPPEIQAMANELAQLRQTVTQQQTTQQQAESAQTQAVIDAFGKDHLYFDNVKPQMIALLRSEQAKDLSEAYDMACWARPDIRPLLLQQQERERAATAEQVARAKAADARQAAGSIAGSPAPGAAPASANTNASIEDDVRAAFASHA